MSALSNCIWTAAVSACAASGSCGVGEVTGAARGAVGTGGGGCGAAGVVVTGAAGFAGACCGGGCCAGFAGVAGTSSSISFGPNGVWMMTLRFVVAGGVCVCGGET